MTQLPPPGQPGRDVAAESQQLDGETEEFANIACFLASDQAGYITGTSINVDGGASPVV